MDNQSREQRVRQQIHLTESDYRRARELAELTDGGNISRLFRRLIRMEAARHDITQPLVTNRDTPESVAA